ncbi:Ig-like domain-containing protein [Elizabethkingia meningoseptica]|uniref:Ig-like domain-containing domain n=1 Tax=Elizabethkingia meningoseptica TaxID=238 RepID=UPI00099B1437|nr:Ig-like domain-containing domain [Elizabethkingia meningoseptica]MDE5438238.1 Ig-like domain-containing protein [Elizabethkingia meningoseptica]MDE5468285.1 Ig-like domain-containing protein [Elizabethkingia meningoseptica]MDE5475662.1 Ig-like domain-containing protein [Elizabethkingia meningoseptica]MDE5479538.1 Ig-like domain-containing protein [Elizabethkingia meningoseptica]MDE5485485.1 Ig-like domain-containing protein [Elizabethkingia meningoseptica]
MRNAFFLFFILLIFSCARVGSPNGGEKDKTPPRVLSSSPDSLAKNVPTSLKELRIDFDEYVTLKDASKQLVISPPIKKIKKMIPSSIANKYVLIQWEDTLQANTTYNFNFGNSIADNNEGNILPYYSLVFSTGKTIDSLYISGNVDDVLNPRKKKKGETITTADKEKPMVVGLYKADAKDYKDKPYYISRVDPDGYFELNYLAAGDYNIIAFQDDNQNQIYDPGKEKIAFLPEPIHLEKNIKGLRLLVSPPKKKFKYIETKTIPGGLNMLFEGKPDSLQLKQVGDALSDFKIVHKPTSDSAYVWINPKANNFKDASVNLKFSYYNSVKKKVDTTSTYYKVNPKDELTLNNQSGTTLPPGSGLKLKANMALDNVDFAQWELKADSTVVVPFKASISRSNPFEINLDAEMQTGKKYSLRVAKESVSAFYFKNAKPIIYNFDIGKKDDYGSLVFELTNAPTAPFWIQLLNDNFEVVKEQKVEGKTEIKFDNLKAETYSIRILVDNNKNGVWDGADFENHIQPEEAYLFRKKMTVKPLWEMKEPWDLKDTSKNDKEDEDESLMPSGTGIKTIEEQEREKAKEKPKEDKNKKDPNNLLLQQQQQMLNQGYTTPR